MDIEKTLIFSNVVYFCSKIVFWKANSFGLFLLERFLLSVALAGLSGVDISILYLSSKKGESQKVFSIYRALSTAGMLTGCAIFTLFLSNNYDGCAFVTMITYGIAALLSFFLVEVKGDIEEKQQPLIQQLKTTILYTLKDVKFLVFLLGVSLFGNASWIISVMIYQDKYQMLGLNGQQMGIVQILVSIVGLFTISSAFLTEKIGFKKFLFLICGIMAVFSLIMGYTTNIVFAVLAQIVLDLGYGISLPLVNDLQSKRVSLAD